MIAIKVELWPGGNRDRAKLLGLAFIANDGSGDRSSGNYRAVFKHKPPNGSEYTGRVEGFPRLRLNVWDLLLRALRSAVGDRNPEAKAPPALPVPSAGVPRQGVL